VGLALALKPPHLSLYHLTVEPNTRFAVQPPPQLPDDDSAYDMLDHLLARTQEAGLQRYEVSAFARPGHRCTHNLNYWRFGDYLGMGAGAHGKLSFAHRIVRQTKWREPARYMDEALNGRALSNEQAVAVAQLPFEFMLNGLRLVDGVSLLAYQERTGQPLWSLDAALQQAQAAGLLERADPMVKPSARGLDFLSDLQAMFLPDDAA